VATDHVIRNATTIFVPSHILLSPLLGDLIVTVGRPLTMLVLPWVLVCSFSLRTSAEGRGVIA